MRVAVQIPVDFFRFNKGIKSSAVYSFIWENAQRLGTFVQ